MRLIDADMADVVIIYDKGNELTQVSAIREYIERQKAFLDKFPTIDAVPVVRCEKCEHWVKNDDGQCVCALFDIANSYGEPVMTKPDNFCSYGKRKGCAD